MRWGGNIDGKRYKGLENIDEDINRKILEREKRKNMKIREKNEELSIDKQKRGKNTYTQKKNQ